MPQKYSSACLTSKKPQFCGSQKKMNTLFYYFKLIINLFNRQRIKVLFSSNNIIIVDKQYDMKINSNNETEVTFY